MHKVFALFAILLTTLAAHAMTCIGPITVCSSFDKSTMVFRGRVVEITPVPLTPTPTSNSIPLAAGSKLVTRAVQGEERVRLEVLEVFKGDPGSEITITAPEQDRSFTLGNETIVFANSYGTGKIYAGGICSRTHPLTDTREDADLAWLRAYPTAPPKATIFGSVSRHDRTPGRVAATLALTGEERHTAALDEKNNYKFENLLPGTYTVTASLPAGWVAYGPQTVTVAAKSCAEVDWYVDYDSHIKGRVTDAAGKPLVGLSVSLLKPSDNRVGYTYAAGLVTTSADGEYDVAKTAPGDYWVALYERGPTNNYLHYAPVFYPAASTTAGAKLLHLSASETLEGIDLVRPEPLQPAVVHARVKRPDGSPVDQAKFDAIDPAFPTRANPGTADETGQAELHLIAGREYLLTAWSEDGKQPECAGPVKFTAKDGLVLDVLTLDKSFHACRTAQSSSQPCKVPASLSNPPANGK
jgi:hypothetical protein